MTRQCYRFIASGRVQGVFYRQSSMEHARQLGLSGWVRNCADGRVEGIAQGTAEALEQFRAWLCRGPETARVDGLQWIAADVPPCSGFEVRR
ncbi:MAG: acylphosphatase [Stenotrophobium sp.]